MLNIVLFGPPGAGKGTQSEKIIEKYQLIHLSTGDILRDEIKRGTELGLKAKVLMDAGNLVPDEVVIGMIANKVKDNLHAKGFIFDGFPRTTAQAEALDNLLEQLDLSISKMIALQVADDELRTRLQERAKVSGRADDADLNKINNRIEVYKSSTLPVADYYKSQNKFIGINGVGSIKEIFESICKQLDALKA